MLHLFSILWNPLLLKNMNIAMELVGFFDWLVGWHLVGWLVQFMIGWLFWLVGWLIGLLVGWLNG